MPKGRFITLEGGEGAGKSTLLQSLAAALGTRGLEIVTTREPGGSPGANEIRALLVSGDGARWDGLEETLLLAAARASHLRHTIRPALARGAWVICDRYVDSTRAYQSAAGGVSSDVVEQLTALIDAPAPDATLILDLDPAQGLARSQGGGKGEDRFELRGLEFHQRVRTAFLAIANADPQRCAVLDASKGPEAVCAAALNELNARL